MAFDTGHLIDLAAFKACQDVARDMSLTERDRASILDAVIQIVDSGYGTTSTGSRDLHDIVVATVVRFRSIG